MRKIPLFHKGMTVFFNFFKKSATKRLLAYRYGARKGNLTFFQNYSLNRGFHSLYGVKEENIFILNLTFGSCRSLYGAKKIFHSIVGNNGVAWVGAEKWIELIKEYSVPKELTAPLLNAMIEKILIHEATTNEDNERIQEIEIYYRFIGKVD